MSDEDPNIEWGPLSNEHVFLEGVTHEMYCTLCGVPFDFDCDIRHRYSKNGVDCFVWSSYFLARK